jgi:hypothetical protein
VAPLPDDLAVPPLPLDRAAIAIAIALAAIAATVWAATRRAWLYPWWFVVACALFVAIRGEPTLSMPMIYPPLGKDLFVTWLAALPIAVAATWFGVARVGLARAIVAQLALPVAAATAALTACGAWPLLFGAELAPIAPRFTAWTSPLLLVAAHGAAAAALAVLGTLGLRAIGRRSRSEPARSSPAAG